QMEVECLSLKDLTSPRKSFMENICTERRRSTPLKSAESIIPALLINRNGVTADLTHITPIKHTALAEPWTPTANLKMLISAASPDIRDREMKKMLFRPIENEKDKTPSPDTVVENMEVEDSCQFEAVDEEDDVEKKPSRKQKSLGLLCQKFLALYPDYPDPQSPIWISLDEVATSLGVERRRIYDIVNVLESLMIVGRIAKNSYTWYGRQRLGPTLEELQQRGWQQGYHLQMEFDTLYVPMMFAAGVNRRDKSLRIMSQKFVMLFLVSKTQTVTLDVAAKILIEESHDSSSHSKYKTKVRRLYDIANILTSLGLIKKVREERGRKPAFKWLGPVKFNNSGNAVSISNSMAGQDLRKSKLARHASFNITPTSVVVKRQISSAPSSLQNQPVDYSRKPTNNSAVCRLQFGNRTDSGEFYFFTSFNHYKCVLSSPGLNSLGLLLSAGQPPASLAVPPSSVPTLLPYVLVPSAALSHYPLMAGSLQQQGSDTPTNLSFSVPAVMSPVHFTMGAAPYSLTAASEISWSPHFSILTNSNMMQCECFCESPDLPHFLLPQTPHTPKDSTASASKAFFQTPGTLGSVVSSAPAARKRGSAQRRLDVGHPPTS
uniref:Transcription factor E2F7 n=1 Tax=Monopterus albus TaxID=43700 RepID=A0A3Q3JQZ5_MONAL